ncbi:unnamed protein product, partial [Rotaria magnacalcarata]
KIEKLQSAACEWKSSTRNGQQRAVNSTCYDDPRKDRSEPAACQGM